MSSLSEKSIESAIRALRWRLLRPSEGEARALMLVRDAGRLRPEHVEIASPSPALDHHARTLLDAFDELSTDRRVGVAPGPIPYTAIQAFADAEQMGRVASRVFRAAIRRLDAEYLTLTVPSQLHRKAV